MGAAFNPLPIRYDTSIAAGKMRELLEVAIRTRDSELASHIVIVNDTIGPIETASARGTLVAVTWISANRCRALLRGYLSYCWNGLKL